MKIITLATVAAFAIATVAWSVLSTEQRPAYEAFVGSGADVRDPGHNLVGPTWNGLNRETNPAS